MTPEKKAARENPTNTGSWITINFGATAPPLKEQIVQQGFSMAVDGVLKMQRQIDAIGSGSISVAPPTTGRLG